MWDEITYPFPNFKVEPFKNWEWISKFIPHFSWHVINLSMLALKLNHDCGKGPGVRFRIHLRQFRAKQL